MSSRLDGVHDYGVREVVELLDLLPLDIRRSGASEDARQPRFADPAAYDFGSQADLLEKAREVPGGLRHAALAIEQVPF
jgi:hypothetical protein